MYEIAEPVRHSEVSATGVTGNDGFAPASFIADLLQRTSEPEYSDQARQAIHGQTVLVTGAGGSIGSEIVRQVNRLDPRRVYLLDHDEGALHALQLELQGHGLLNDERIVLADIRDGEVMDRLFSSTCSSVVFHAAAHKHLPLLERYPVEAVKTNVLGTANVVAAAARAGVQQFVNISTDKAAAPTSVLGETKRLAEAIVAAWAGGSMRVASVRFGNVLGSRGSFLPTLTWQLRRGLPVTITDSAATRYFMTIPEAASLVVEASAMANAGETYVLDMGDPVRIEDLVFQAARKLGMSPTIVYTGLRPGEKLHEKLLDAVEQLEPTRHPRISCVRNVHPLDPDLLANLDLISSIVHFEPDAVVREQLRWVLANSVGVTPTGALTSGN